MEKGGVLYSGFDESNHAVNLKTSCQDRILVGEIVAGAFSFLDKDGKVRIQPGRNCSKVRRLLESDERDYRFLTLNGERYRFTRAENNLVFAVPLLIDNYLTGLDFIPETLKVYLDGHIFGSQKRKLRSSLSEKFDIPNVVVDNFTKKSRKGGKFRKGMNCPRVVYMADVLSNHLLNSPYREVVRNSRRVEVG